MKCATSMFYCPRNLQSPVPHFNSPQSQKILLIRYALGKIVILLLLQQTEERRISIGVRAHDTIELLEDRLYVVTCGKAGFQNSRNEVSVVQLKVTDG